MTGMMRAVVIFVLGAFVASAACSIPVEPTRGAEASPVRFSDDDRALIREYYSRFEFPPDLQDPDALALDLEQRIELSATLPPDIAAFPLPLELHQQLGPLPPGYARFRTGQDVVLMDVRTRQVVDLVVEVFSPALAPWKTP